LQLDYVACIICGKTVSRNKFSFEPFSIEPLDYIILQRREQRGGRSKEEGKQAGFFIIPEESKNILELWNSGDPDEKAIVEAFKNKLLTVLKAYLSAGIITREELVP
jgi:hypothetical protein